APARFGANLTGEMIRRHVFAGVRNWSLMRMPPLERRNYASVRHNLTSATSAPSVPALRFADFAVPPMVDFVRTRLRGCGGPSRLPIQSVQEEEGAACVLFRRF